MAQNIALKWKNIELQLQYFIRFYSKQSPKEHKTLKIKIINNNKNFNKYGRALGCKAKSKIYTLYKNINFSCVC